MSADTTATGLPMPAAEPVQVLANVEPARLMSGEARPPVTRSERIRSAVLKRIGARGDMEIPVSFWTLASLFGDLGLPAYATSMRERGDLFYDVPARVLEPLVLAAGREVARGDEAEARVRGVLGMIRR